MTKPRSYGRVGELIKAQRERLGWGQEELAERTGLSQNTISRIENTATPGYLPLFPHRKPLADALGLRLVEIYAAADPHLRDELAGELSADDQLTDAQLETRILSDLDRLATRDPLVAELSTPLRDMFRILRQAANSTWRGRVIGQG